MCLWLWWFLLGLSNPLVLHFRIFGSIFPEYSVIRRIWACHERGSINGRGHRLIIYLKKKIVITICTFTWFEVRICRERNLWQYYLYTGHEIEDTLDIDNKNSYYFMSKIRAWKLEFRTSLKFKLKVLFKKLNYLHSLIKDYCVFYWQCSQ